MKTLILVRILVGVVIGSVVFVLACACLALHIRRRNIRRHAPLGTPMISGPRPEPFSSHHTTSEADSPSMTVITAGEPRRTTTSSRCSTGTSTSPLHIGSAPHDSATVYLPHCQTSDTVPHEPDWTQSTQTQPELLDSIEQAGTEIRISARFKRNGMAISPLDQAIDLSIGAELRREMASLRAEMARLRSETECAPFREPPPAYD